MTVQEAITTLKVMKERASFSDVEKAIEKGIEAIEEIEQYRALGTVEELKEAREKQIPKKPIVKSLGEDIEVECPVCGHIHIFLQAKKGDKYCNECGQAIDWESDHLGEVNGMVKEGD